MTEHQGIPDGDPMVEIYDVTTDEMVLAPKSLADRAELLKQAWIASTGLDPEMVVTIANPHMGNHALYEAAQDAANELRASFITRPGDPLPQPRRRGSLKPESLADHHKRHRRARRRGPKET